jgi:hypothetical protein
MNLNIFSNCRSKEPGINTLDQIVDDIKNNVGRRKLTENYRKALRQDKELNAVSTDGEQHDHASHLKQSMPCFMPAAYVNNRRALSDVTALTGLTMCDFDHLPHESMQEMRRKITSDPHTLLCHITASGEGLRVLARYELPQRLPAKDFKRFYSNCFSYVNNYYTRITGAQTDDKCKDLVRLSIACSDPLAYYQPEAIPFSIAEMETEAPLLKPQGRPRSTTRQRKQALMQVGQIVETKILPFLKERNIQFRTGDHNRYVMNVGYLLNRYGVDKADALAWAKEKYSMAYPTALSVIESCYRATDQHGELAGELDSSLQRVRASQMPIANTREIDRFLEGRVEARRNVVKNTVEIKWKRIDKDDDPTQFYTTPHVFRDVSDEDLNTLAGYIETDCELRASADDIRCRLKSKHTRAFHPFSNYLDSLPEWTPSDPDYIAQLADTVQIIDDDPQAQHHFALWLKKWLVGMVTGWISDNEVNQTMLIFTGQQGTYKTRWMSHLLPPELREYHKLKLNSSNISKDDVLAMAQYGLVQHEEIDALGMRENSDIKAMLTATYSNERAPYERNAVRRNHIASLCGTSNEDHILSDATGSRRSLVFRVQVIAPPTPEHPFNYTGIYSQAKALMRDPDFHYYFNTEEQAEVEKHNRQFETVNSEEELILRVFRKPTVHDEGRIKWLTPTEVIMALRDYSHNFNLDVNKVGRIMKKLGFQKTKPKHGGRVGYLVMQRCYDEIDRDQRQIAMDISKKARNQQPN